MRAEADLVVVHGEMGHATAEPKQQLARFPITLVLQDGIFDVCFVRLFFSSKVAIGSPLISRGSSD